MILSWNLLMVEGEKKKYFVKRFKIIETFQFENQHRYRF